MSRIELLTEIKNSEAVELALGVAVYLLASGSTGAVGLTTSLAVIRPNSELPYHQHPFSEVIVAVAGEALVRVEGRSYRLRPFDAIHVPAMTPHAVQNLQDQDTILHTSFASATPTREAIDREFPIENLEHSTPSTPETLVRFETAEVYELAPQAHFRDLFGAKFGARGVCGGYGVFEPGASLPCHYHDYDESITIVTGQAVCQVAGREYSLSDCGTACIPRGRPHRFINRSNQPMAMIWVYAGDAPERTMVEASFCGIAQRSSEAG